MRKIYISTQVLAVAALLLLTSCSPKIQTSVLKRYPARSEGSPVVVYRLADSVALPAETEVLGVVNVEDGGFTTGCSYDKVLQLAKEQVNRHGGNGLYLTWHKEPSALGSSCHQLGGEMLLLPDSEDSYYNAVELPSQPPKPAGKGRHAFLLSAGGGFVTSDLYLTPGLSGNPKQGFDANVAYQWVSAKGFGIGVRYSGYFTSVDGFMDKLKMRVHYFAPEFVMRGKIGRDWELHCSAGFGYASYVEKVDMLSASIDGYGSHLDLGVERKLSEHVSLGGGIGLYGTLFKDLDQYNDDDQKGGISRISLTAGLRFHF